MKMIIFINIFKNIFNNDLKDFKEDIYIYYKNNYFERWWLSNIILNHKKIG